MTTPKKSGRTLAGLTRRVLLGTTFIAAAALLPGQAFAQMSTFAAGRYSSAEGGVAAAVTPGTDIPAADLRLGIMPYGDHSILVIGIQAGFFTEAGISILPAPLGEITQIDEAVPRLAGNALDITTWYTSLKVGAMAQTPDLTMIGYHDVYIGTYMLAAPWTEAKTVDQFVAEGMTFEAAMNAAASQMVGKRVAIANDGAHRDFTNTLFTVGNIDPSSVTLQAIPDNQQVELANSQRLDFASPSGAAQTVELMNQGWYSIVGTEQLLDGLPPGDPRAVSTVGNTGPGASLAYLENNYDTVLRYMSVQFRIIDEIRENPTEAFAIQAPYLRAAAGTTTTEADLQTIITTLDPLYTFEEQADFWIDTESPYYYATVLQPQIDAAQAGGLLPAGVTYTADDVTVGAGIYRDLVALKEAYDALLPTVPAGADAAILAAAATHYENRNYLDAYRMLRAASGA